jgi:DNA polymerase-1
MTSPIDLPSHLPIHHVVLVDASGFIFRAFHAIQILTRPDGTPVNAVYGFITMLMKLLDDMQPDHIAIIFDSARKTFRNDIDPSYKANRTEPPDELVPQFTSSPPIPRKRSMREPKSPLCPRIKT